MLKKAIKQFAKSSNNDEGSVLVIALLILVVLTVIGISGTTTTEVEIRIAGNEKAGKIAFYNADSGIFVAPKIISRALDDGQEPALAKITYVEKGLNKFYREIMGFDSHDNDDDISFTLGAFNVDVDVNRTGAHPLAGGGSYPEPGAFLRTVQRIAYRGYLV